MLRGDCTRESRARHAETQGNPRAWLRKMPPGRVLYSLGAMYARKLKVEVVVAGERRPCPLEWLDAFCMRNFTGAAEFDDTLPTGEGTLEASFRVEPERLAAALAEWLTKRGKGKGQPVAVEINREE